MLLTWFLVIAGLAALGFLGMGLSQKLGAGRIQSLNEKRRATSRIVSRGEYVDGNRHIEVALALTQSTLLYENGVVQGALDLRWVREIEYDSALATGVEVDGRKVLRLRTDSQSFEFVLPKGFVDPDGRIRQRSVLGARQVLTGTMYARTGRTLFVRWGDVPVILGAVAALLAGLALQARAARPPA